MELYERIGPIGEGTYGIVIKCRNKESGQIVAIKKFLESDDDPEIRKTALREVRMLKSLKHENLVSFIEVFKRKGRLYLVFEHVDRNILKDLELNPHGLPEETSRKCMYQILRAVDYLHEHNVIHRDIKPENVLVSVHGIIKICDFGFARTLAGPGAKYTEYVATRWYRSPELLVGDTEYGKGVDVWACACIFAELLTGNPLFPGDTDIDQLYRITRHLGRLSLRHCQIFSANPIYKGVRVPEVTSVLPLSSKLQRLGYLALNWLEQALVYDPDQRASIKALMAHEYFSGDGFVERLETQLVRVITFERERDQAERLRRRRGKRYMDGQRGSTSRKENLEIDHFVQHRQQLDSTSEKMPAMPSIYTHSINSQIPKITLSHQMPGYSIAPSRSNPIHHGKKQTEQLILPKISLG